MASEGLSAGAADLRNLRAESQMHPKGKHMPVQCTWIYYSSSDWGSILLSYCLFDCGFIIMLTMVFVEYLVALRNLVRNPSCRCIPREAKLAIEWIDNASLEGSSPVVWVLRPPFLLQAYSVYGAVGDVALFSIYHCNRDPLITCFSILFTRYVGMRVFFFSLLVLVLETGHETLYSIGF